MKIKNIIILVGLTGIVFAETSPLKFSGQIRQRYEMVDKDFSNSTGFNNNNYLRTRFAVA